MLFLRETVAPADQKRLRRPVCRADELFDFLRLADMNEHDLVVAGEKRVILPHEPNRRIIVVFHAEKFQVG